jgi:hypothetical protein
MTRGFAVNDTLVRLRLRLLSTCPAWQKSVLPPGWTASHAWSTSFSTFVSGTRRVESLPLTRFFSRMVTLPPSKSTSVTRIRVKSRRWELHLRPNFHKHLPRMRLRHGVWWLAGTWPGA